MPAAIQVMKRVDVLLTVKRVALGLKKDPQSSVGFLDNDAAPVDRHIQYIARIDIMIHEPNRLGVIRTETFQQGAVLTQPDMFDTEHCYRIRAEALLDCCQHIVEPGGG